MFVNEPNPLDLKGQLSSQTGSLTEKEGGEASSRQFTGQPITIDGSDLGNSIELPLAPFTNQYTMTFINNQAP